MPKISEKKRNTLVKSPSREEAYNNLTASSSELQKPSILELRGALIPVLPCYDLVNRLNNSVLELFVRDINT